MNITTLNLNTPYTTEIATECARSCSQTCAGFSSQQFWLTVALTVMVLVAIGLYFFFKKINNDVEKYLRENKKKNVKRKTSK